MFIKKSKYSIVYTSKHAMVFKKDRPLHLMIAIYITSLIVLSIKPIDGLGWWYENIASVIAVAALAGVYKKNRLTNLSYAFILALLILHMVGAHYTYSFCPIGNWIKEFFGLKRNNYDRLVSLAFGALMFLPVLEVLYHRLQLRYIQVCVLSVIIILSICAVYELFEMFSAFLLSSQEATLFLGLQGDVWDAQKDMMMSLIGSLFTMGCCILLKIKKKHRLYMVK